MRAERMKTLSKHVYDAMSLHSYHKSGFDGKKKGFKLVYLKIVPGTSRHHNFRENGMRGLSERSCCELLSA